MLVKPRNELKSMVPYQTGETEEELRRRYGVQEILKCLTMKIHMVFRRL